MSFSNELIGIPVSYWDADIDWVVVGEPAEYMQPDVVSELVEENESGQSFILALPAEEIDEPSVNSDPDSLLKEFYVKGTWRYYS